MTQILLKWEKVTVNGKIWYDSNNIILKGPSGVHLELEGHGNEVSVFQSMTGSNFVTVLHDYFGPLWDTILPFPGIGQTIKFRVNQLPLYSIIGGDIEDGGSGDITENTFAGSDGEIFCGKGGEYFLGKAM